MPQDNSFVPWKQYRSKGKGEGGDLGLTLQVRFKKRYVLMMILVCLGLIWLGVVVFDEDTSEMFFFIAPVLFVPLLMRLPVILAIFSFVIMISCLIYVSFAVSNLVDILGDLTVISLFFVLLPLRGFLWIWLLFDQRPQLLIGPDGTCCRTYGEDVIPWDDIKYAHVSTYERAWFLKVKTLIIGLRRFSAYPKPRFIWAPQNLFYQTSKLTRKPDDATSLYISGIILDPPLPYVLKAIRQNIAETQRNCCRKT